MKLELEIYECLCATKTFRINGIEANYSDFGTKGDQCPWNASEYGCGNMQFIPFDPIPEIMEKYKINEDEWRQVCNALDRLSFGYCNLCV